MEYKKNNLIKIISFLILFFIIISCDNVQDPQPCDGVSCSDHGDCAIDGNSILCICNSGYHENGLNCIENGIVPTCDNFACPDHATCNLNDGSPKCLCNNGYVLEGNICVEKITACSNNP